MQNNAYGIQDLTNDILNDRKLNTIFLIDNDKYIECINDMPLQIQNGLIIYKQIRVTSERYVIMHLDYKFKQYSINTSAMTLPMRDKDLLILNKCLDQVMRDNDNNTLSECYDSVKSYFSELKITIRTVIISQKKQFAFVPMWLFVKTTHNTHLKDDLIVAINASKDQNHYVINIDTKADFVKDMYALRSVIQS